MKTSSCKAKGRALCKYVKERILYHFKYIKESDVKVTSSGANGEDLQLSSYARELFPFSVECKNRASFAIYKDYAQCKTNAKEYIPLLIIKQNNSKPLAVVDLEQFIQLWSGNYEEETTKET